MDCEPTASELWRRRGVMAGLAGVIVVGGAGLHRRWSEPDSSGGRFDVRALFGSDSPASVMQRWRIVAVHPIHMGAIPVVMETADGRRYQVDVLRRDPQGPRAVADTERLSLYVQNQGHGATATDEEQGLGVMALASVLRTREAEGAAIPELLTLRERMARHPEGAFGVALR